MNYKKLSMLVIAWFILAVAASAMHLFENKGNRIGLAVAIAALTPILVFSLWFAASPNFRRFALSWNTEILTALQSWRIIGFVFLLLEARGLLPGLFAFSAGYGDIAIGATASLVAWKFANPRHANLFILWQTLGIMDLVLAVTLGTAAGLINPYGTSMAVMTILPLSLVPTFLVPLFFIFHIVSIRQAKSWKLGPASTGQIVTSVRHSAT
jgi:hypothetical protein